MAKKNKEEANLLSQRIKRASHDDATRKGKAEFNIVVDENKKETPYIQEYGVQQQTSYGNVSQGYSPPQNEQVQQSSYPAYDDGYQADQQPQIESVFESPVQDRHTENSNSFTNRLKQRKRNPPKQTTPDSDLQEFTFESTDPNALLDANGKLKLDDRYSNMFRRKRKKPTPAKEEHNNIGENAIDGKHGNPFKRTLPKKTKLIILITVIVIALLTPQLVFRIPASIKPENELKVAASQGDAQALLDYIKVQNGTADWDKDGIANSADDNVYNPDTDQNGAPDGQNGNDFFVKGEVIQYENVTLEAQKVTMGVSKFLKYYVFYNYKGWVKITDEKGIPFVYTKSGWQEAEYTEESGTFYVKIKNNCYLEFVPKDTKPAYGTDFLGTKIFSNKASRYVKGYGIWSGMYATLLKTFLPVTEQTQTTIASIWHTDTYHVVKQNNIAKADAVLPDTSKYNIKVLEGYEFSYDKLYYAYDLIDKGKTVLISIIRKDGSEATLFAYAYDYLGNLYVCDARTSKTVGVISVQPCAQVYNQNGQNFMREWYEIEGIGFSSIDGDIMIIY